MSVDPELDALLGIKRPKTTPQVRPENGIDPELDAILGIQRQKETPPEPPKKSLFKRAIENIREGVKERDEFRKSGGTYGILGMPITKEQQEAEETPTVDFSAGVTKAAKRFGIDKSKNKIAQGAVGAAEGVGDVLTGFTAPRTIGELAVAGPVRPAALAFIPSLVKGAYEGVLEAKKAYQEGDVRRAARAGAGAVASAVFLKSLAKHGMKDLRAPKAKLKTLEIPEGETPPTPVLAEVPATQPKPKLEVKKPQFDENEVTKVQTELIQDVMKKGDITEDQLGAYLIDAEKDGALYRDITKKHLKGELSKEEAVNQMHDAVAEKPKVEAYRVKAYRGISKETPVDKGHFGKGTYYSTSKVVARNYGGKNITEDNIELKKPFIIDARGTEGMMRANEIIKESDTLRSKLEKQGYDGVVIKDWGGTNVDEVVVFAPKKTLVRSKPSIQIPAKDTWNMTKAEYAKQEKAGNVAWENELGPEDHRVIVSNALKEGKPVPPEVLKDYPNLVPKKTLAPEKRLTLIDRAREADPELTEMDLRWAAKELADNLADVQGKGKKNLIVRGQAKILQRYYETGKELGPKGGGGGVFDYYGDQIIDRAREVKHLEKTTVQDIPTADLNLKKGDQVKTGGEWLKVTEATPEKLVLKDGQKIEVDPVFDKLPIEGGEFGIKRAGALGDVESKLYKEIEESVGETPAPVGLTVRKVGRQPGQSKGEGFAFKNPEIEVRYKASHGVKPEEFKARVKETLANIWHRMTREYEHLPRTAEFAPLRFALHKLDRMREVSGDRTIRLLQGVTQFLDKNQYDVFERKVILDDLMQEAKAGHKLPFGFTPDQLAEEHGRVSAVSDANVAEALAKRKAVWDAVKADYIKAMDDIGFDVSERVAKEDYFRHQVLEYAQLKGTVKGQKKLGTPAYRGFLKKREGSTYDINTDYLQAEHEVMAQMLYDIEIAKTIKLLDSQYNIQPQLRKEATKLREQGQDVDWHELVPEGYDVWQPREGSVFYMADSVPARLAEQLYSKVAEGINISKADVKKIMAVGGKRKEYVIKKEIVDTLNKISTPDDYFEQLASKTLRGWKVWQLISPRRWIKYNLRNLTGDSDGAFAGNPSGFRKTPRAVRELYRMYSTDAPPSSPEMKSYYERGGFGTLLQAQEMGDINRLKMFERFLETRGTAGGIPVNVWQRYWKSARLSTDFREGILRYANYLDYLEQMKKDPNGRPRNFGASIPEEVMALKSIEDRAFKLSNDLLGAYDEVSVFGQWLRKYIWPFWSWKEVNFRRYYQIFKNAANDNQLATTIGRKAAGTIVRSPLLALKIGKFALKATAFTAFLQTWNYSFFKKEEEMLPEGIRNKPHIIFGRNDKGEIIYFSRLGALSDLLEWFSIDDAPQDISDFLNGRRSLKEILIDMAKAPVNVMWSGLSPVIKQPSELAAGKSTYPDVFRPKTIRDRYRYLAQSVGLENEYDAITKKPSKGYLKSLGNLLYYTIEPGQGAYSDTYDMKQRYLKRIGKYGEGGFISPRSNALYYAKLAVRYKDIEAFKKNLADYIMLGGTREGLERSLEFLHPLSGLSKEDKVRFVASLNEDDKIKVARAIKFYDKVINPVSTREWFIGQYGVMKQKLKQEGKLK